ncbi:MAG TPA: hypothetical protein VMD53_03990 [Rhizomicrobium sp.]|nr:hypothetical protein [Rhizomicrobium sp.]
MFLLGLRHGLDPDHIAIIDNLTFRAVDTRRRLAPWTGTLFAAGHSISVAIVAIGAAIVMRGVRWPSWMSLAADWAVISLLIGVGIANLVALRKPGRYVAAGWRQVLLPRKLRNTEHPLAIVAVGAIFGLVFDTATQAAAWGLAAASQAGVIGAVWVAAVFATGMVITDSADSMVVARLLINRGGDVSVNQYRRGMGWLIVGLSFGMACYEVLDRYTVMVAALPDWAFSLMGGAMAISVAGALCYGRMVPARARPEATSSGRPR